MVYDIWSFASRGINMASLLDNCLINLYSGHRFDTYCYDQNVKIEYVSNFLLKLNLFLCFVLQMKKM